MRGITPGALCFIVSCDTPSWVGRVVTTGRQLTCQGSIIDGQWEIYAAWLPPAIPCWYAQSWCLQPITDPEIHASEHGLMDLIGWSGVAPGSTSTPTST